MAVVGLETGMTCCEGVREPAPGSGACHASPTQTHSINSTTQTRSINSTTQTHSIDSTAQIHSINSTAPLHRDQSSKHTTASTLQQAHYTANRLAPPSPRHQFKYDFRTLNSNSNPKFEYLTKLEF